MKFLVSALALTLLAACATPKATTPDAHSQPGATAPASSAVKTAGVMTCTKAKDVRTIFRREGKAGGCEVVYTVNGKEKVIATAQHDKSYCDKVAEKTKANLTNDHYTCE